MAIYLIHGYDNVYHGLQGKELWTIEECSQDEALDIARDLSQEVINSYSSITDILKERANDYLSYDLDEEYVSIADVEKRYIFYYDAAVKEDMNCDIIKLESGYSLEQYLTMIASGAYSYEELGEEFGEEEIV